MKRKHSFYPIGFVILLAAFLSLAFFTLSAICLTSAVNESRASESYITSSQDYAKAYSKAAAEVAALDTADHSNQTVSAVIDDDHTLCVNAVYQAETDSYIIADTEIILTKDWQADTTLPLVRSDQ